MVRVLRCHHFSAQDVFTTDNEPLTIYTTPELCFVATDQCYIEVYKLQEPGCPRAYRFPTVATVKSLVYSEGGDFIATLEEKQAASESQISIRVYLNWRADLSVQPMRASIAGHMTSLRHADADKSRFEVVEVPLKGTPRCIAVDPAFGAVAVGIEQSLLVYGFCTKTVAETKEQYKDMKCLLELEFSFEIHQVALVEDYLAVSSESEVQVVMFKIPLRSRPDINDCSGMSATRHHGDSNLSLVGTSTFTTAVNDLIAFDNRASYTPSPSQSSVSSLGNEPVRENDYIIEDEHFIQWTFDDPDCDIQIAKTTKSSKMASVAAASAQAVKTIVLKGLATVQGKKLAAALHSGSWELLGPVDNPVDCPVTVEYEDVCSPSCKKRGHVIHGVRTCLYRKFEDDAPSLHSLQLVPVYLHASHTRKGETTRCCVLCPGLNRDSLVGMSVFISTQESGFLYNVQDAARLLAIYPYTAPALHVSVSEHLVYALTTDGLEVYTSRGTACALHHVSPVDNTTNTLPPADLEPCLVGIQPFIGTQEVAVSTGLVVLLTKHITTPAEAASESSWSLYVLRSQPITDLYHDMMELAEQHRMTSLPASLHLVQEAHLLLRTHRFLHGSDDDTLHALICDSAAFLGDYYASAESEGEWPLALPYYVISGLDVGSVVQRAQAGRNAKKAVGFGQGLLRYLDYMIFRQDHPIACSQSDGDLVLGVYADLCPDRLSAVILRATLHNYSPEKALVYLDKWMQQEDKDQESSRLDVLASAVLHTKLGQPDEAEIKLFSVSQGDIFKTCVANPWILHEEFVQFSPLAQMLCRHHRKLFIKILVALLEEGVLRVDQTLAILQGKSTHPLSENRYVMDYLELILTDDCRERFFQDSARRLVEIYLDLIQKGPTVMTTPTAAVSVRDVIPKGRGHFAKRFTWLDFLPPFTGPKSQKTPCVRLHGEVGKGPEQLTCTCCSCNAELLKLQSLLCSGHISWELLHFVSAQLAHIAGMRGGGSLQVLCAARLRPEEAISKMFNDYPTGLIHYVQEMLGSNTQLWQHLVECIVNKMKRDEGSKNGSHEKTAINDADSIKESMRGLDLQDGPTSKDASPDFANILAYMAEVLPQKDVISLVPKEGSTRVFLPAVIRTQEKHCAQLLKDRIVNHARQLHQHPA